MNPSRSAIDIMQLLLVISEFYPIWACFSVARPVRAGRAGGVAAGPRLGDHTARPERSMGMTYWQR